METYHARCVLAFCQAIELALQDEEEPTEAIIAEARAAVCQVISDYARKCRQRERAHGGFITTWRSANFCRE